MTTTDHYVRELIAKLPAVGDLRERVREEVEGHLNDARSDLKRQGLPPVKAEERAVARFGSRRGGGPALPTGAGAAGAASAAL